MPDLAEQLRTLVDAAAAPLPLAEVVGPTSTARRRGHRRQWAAVALVAAVAFITVAVVGGQRGRHVERVASGGVDAPGWHALSPGPLSARTGTVMAWTGTRLLIWGGIPAGRDGGLNDGASYDPKTDRWQKLAPSPLPARQIGHFGVWDGTELLVWEQDSAGGEGAAYNPTSNRWRRLPPSPLPGAADPTLVWDGHDVLAWSASRPDGTTRAPATFMAAFDPARDRWRSLPAGPLNVNNAAAAWDGTELLMLGWLSNAADGVLPAGGSHPAAAYNPVTSEWRDLPVPPWDPAENGSALTMTWTGQEAVAHTYGLKAASYDPMSNRWRSLPDLPLQARECDPHLATNSRAALAFYCGQAALFEALTATWTPLSTPFDTTPPQNSAATYAPSDPPVAAGARFLLWGAGPSASEQRTVAWAYIPHP